MAGYWPSSFFAFFLTETKSRSIKTQHITSPLFSNFDRTREKREILLAGPAREIPSGQDGPLLPARVANHNAGFALSCTLADSSL